MNQITLENAFEIAVQSLYCGDDLTSITIGDDFTLDICLHGETWDGLLDYRVGEFLTTLQRDIFSVYNKATNSSISLRSRQELISPLTVKVCAQKKCLSLKLFFKFLSKIAPHMKSEDIAKVLIAATVLAGLYFYEDIERDKAIQTEQIHAKAQVELARIESNERIQKQISSSQIDLVKEVRKTVTEALDSATNAQHHKAIIAKHMDTEDELQINGIELSKAEAKNLFMAPDQHPTLLSQSYFIDGTYSIKSVSFEEQQVTLNIDGKTVRAITKFLDEKSKKRLYDIFKQADLEGRIPIVDLWLVAEIRGQDLLETAVTGLGKKRPEAKSLKNLLKPQVAHKKTVEKQLNLY